MNKLNKLFGVPLVISLKRRQDRRDTFADVARKHHFDFKFFDAIELQPNRDYTASGLGLNNLIHNAIYGEAFPFHIGHRMSLTGRPEHRDAYRRRLGIAGCRLSHLECMQLSNFIMEDDALLTDDWEKAVPLLENPPAYDELLLHSIAKEKACELYAEGWMRVVKQVTGGGAYVLTTRGYTVKQGFMLNARADYHWDMGISVAGYYSDAIVIRLMGFEPVHVSRADSNTSGGETRLDNVSIPTFWD